MVDSTDHVTGKAGLAAGLTIYATKAAGTPGVITPTVTELDSTNVKGVYKLALTSSHTDTLGELQLHIAATGADPSDVKWHVSTYLPGGGATVEEIDAQLSDTHGAGAWGGATGEGSTSWPITVTDGFNPLDGVVVWVTTDSAGINIVASGVTDAFGIATFMLDPGVYYFWKQLAGYNFTNPQTDTVT